MVTMMDELSWQGLEVYALAIDGFPQGEVRLKHKDRCSNGKIRKRVLPSLLSDFP